MRPSLTVGITIVALAVATVAAVGVRFIAPPEARVDLGYDAGVETYQRSATGTAAVGFSEIAAAGKDAPGGALLSWWQSIQTGAGAAEVANSYLATAAPARERLAGQLKRLRYLFLEAKPQLVDAQRDGSSARVLVVLTRPGAQQGQQPLTFGLVRANGRWLLADNDFLDKRDRAERRFASSKSRRERSGGPKAGR